MFIFLSNQFSFNWGRSGEWQPIESATAANQLWLSWFASGRRGEEWLQGFPSGAWMTCKIIQSQVISLGEKVMSLFLNILSLPCTPDNWNYCSGTRKWGLALCGHLHRDVLEVPMMWLPKRTQTKRRNPSPCFHCLLCKMAVIIISIS